MVRCRRAGRRASGGLDGHEVVADVGCGNGAYLARLTRDGRHGPVLGVDLSPGMLAAARRAAPAARLTCGDAAYLPVRAGAADITLAMHMLYHVPEPDRAVAELRRITRPGGRVVVALNSRGHLRELRKLVAAGFAASGYQAGQVSSASPWTRVRGCSEASSARSSGMTCPGGC